MTVRQNQSIPESRSAGGRSPNGTPVILEEPLIRFGRETCGDLAAALRREWLVTNGLGGYASGTLSGINTRRYHGLLVAALDPPVARTVLVGDVIEQVTYAGETFALSTHEYGDGTIDPHGYRNLQSFRLEGALPVWTFAIADALLERRVWMAHGVNTTYLSYQLVRATGELDLSVTPLVTCRDFHALTSGQGWRPDVDAGPRDVTVRPWPSAHPFRLIADSGEFRTAADWYWNFLYLEESARGLDDRADLFAPGAFSVRLRPGEVLNLTFTAEASEPEDADISLDAERARQLGVLHNANAHQADPVIQQLTLAADQFIVQRMTSDASPGKTVIAGYHWFNDWGRDTMISLPGLTLATNRFDEAADILRT
ncbi:MAG: amylo-alpha-1,6-glucosidase, partial [Chloroflexota bacterium]|nr:amylo-alpha-1,6-glucosidase [Chloroflexota bacterium]